MRKLLLSTVAVVGFAGVASAADLPRRAVAPIVPIAPAFTWTGFYIGVNAGAAFQTEDDEDDLFGGDFGSDNIRINAGTIRGSERSAGRLRLNGGNGDFLNDDDDSDVGFSGGGQIGFNYQFTPGTGFVVGVEADIQYIDLGGNGRGNRQSTDNFTFTADNPNFGPAGPNTFGAAFDPRGERTNPDTGQFGGPARRVVRGGLSASSIDAFGTVRGRIGYAFDRTLIYATGGFAYGFGGDDNDNDLFDNAGLFDDGDDDFKFGYTVGGGVEFALSNFSLFGSSTATFKIEGLYVNLEEDSNGGNDRATYSRITRTLRLPSGNTDNGNELEFAVVRAGINFKF